MGTDQGLIDTYFRNAESAESQSTRKEVLIHEKENAR